MYRDSLPERAGVYAICAPPPSPESNLPLGLMNVLYVGESENLRRRFVEHSKTSDGRLAAAKRCYADSLQFWWSEIVGHPEQELSDKERIVQVEAALLRAFGPPINLKGEIVIPATIGIGRRP